MFLLLPEFHFHFISIWLSLIFQNRAASGGRVGATAAVYSAAILGMCIHELSETTKLNNTIEYLTAEVLELAGNASKDLKVSSNNLYTSEMW